MTVTNYLWDEDSYLEEYDEVGTTTAAYTNEPTEFGSVVSQRRNSTTSYYHYDALGSTTELSDSTETVTDTYLYDAWGNIVTSTGTTVNPFRWIGSVGYYRDEETESYYVRARTYQPIIGRWISIDPLRFVDGMNQYKYVGNRLLYFIDPSGLASRTYKVYEMQITGDHDVNTVIAEITVSTQIDTSECKEECGECLGEAKLTVSFSWKALTNDLSHNPSYGGFGRPTRGAIICHGLNCNDLTWTPPPGGGTTVGGTAAGSIKNGTMACDGGSTSGLAHIIYGRTAANFKRWVERNRGEGETYDESFKNERRLYTYFVIHYSAEMSVYEPDDENCGDIKKDDVTLDVALRVRGVWPEDSKRIEEIVERRSVT